MIDCQFYGVWGLGLGVSANATPCTQIWQPIRQVCHLDSKSCEAQGWPFSIDANQAYKYREPQI